jgi:ddrB-like ParB superfamily domain/P-loop containing NTP hydrolase pore-1/Large polyvalent protein associated domain 38/C-terminal domain on Strawberry notch homologue/N-6 DNA Methylase
LEKGLSRLASSFYEQEQEKLRRRREALMRGLRTGNSRLQRPGLSSDDPYTHNTVTSASSSGSSLNEESLADSSGAGHSFSNAIKKGIARKGKEYVYDINNLRKDLSDNDGFDLGDIWDVVKFGVSSIPGPMGKTAKGALYSNKEKPKDSFFERQGSNFRAGVGDVVEGAGNIMKWAGSKTGAESLQKAGSRVADFAEDHLIKDFEQPYDKEFNWKSLMDPDFYSSSVARSMPFMYSMIVPGIVGAGVGSKAGSLAANATNLGAKGKSIIRGLGTGLGGATATAPFEAAFEAGSVFDDLVKKGASEEEADAEANGVFWKNLGVLGVSNTAEFAAMFAPGGRTALRTAGAIGGSALLEGGQEVAQTFIQADALDEKVKPSQWKEAFAIGGLMGGGMAAMARIGGGDPVRMIENNVMQRIPDRLRSETDRLREYLHSQGATPEEIEAEVAEYVAEDEEGGSIFQEEAQRLAQKLHEQTDEDETAEADIPEPEAELQDVDEYNPGDRVFINGRNGMFEVVDNSDPSKLKLQTVTTLGKPVELEVGRNNVFKDPNRSNLAGAMESMVAGTAQAQVQGEQPQVQAPQKDLKDMTPDEVNAAFDLVDNQQTQAPVQTEMPTAEQLQNQMAQMQDAVAQQNQQVKAAANTADALQANVTGSIPAPILKHLNDNPGVTVQDIQKKFKIGKKKAQEYLNSMEVQMPAVQPKMESPEERVQKKLKADHESRKAPIEGFQNGFRFEDFKKGDTVYHRDFRTGELKETKVNGLVKGKNANGKDVIRNVELENNVTFIGPNQISDYLFKKTGESQSDASFKEGDGVSFKLKGKDLTGRIRNLTETTSGKPAATVDVDQTSSAGGVAIGRLEVVPLDRLAKDAAEPVNVKAEKPNKYDKARDNLKWLDDLADKTDAYLKENKDRMNALPLDLFAAGVVSGARKMAHGAINFAEWSEAMIQEFGQEVRLSLRGLYAQADAFLNEFTPEERLEYMQSTGIDRFAEGNNLGAETQEETTPTAEEVPEANEPEQTETPAEETKTASYKMPWQLSKDAFMADESWKAEHAGSKEKKKAHYIIKPDGKRYSGGWDAHGNSLKQAKESFHAEQLYWHLRANVEDVSAEAVKSYPDLSLDYKNFKEAKKAVTVDAENLTFTVKTDGKSQTFKIKDYPTDLVSLSEEGGSRTFVAKHKLVGTQRGKWKKGRWDIQEVVVNAIYQKINDVMGEKFPIGSEVEFQQNAKVRNTGKVIKLGPRPTVETADKSWYGADYETMTPVNGTAKTPAVSQKKADETSLLGKLTASRRFADMSESAKEKVIAEIESKHKDNGEVPFAVAFHDDGFDIHLMAAGMKEDLIQKQLTNKNYYNGKPHDAVVLTKADRAKAFPGFVPSNENETIIEPSGTNESTGKPTYEYKEVGSKWVIIPLKVPTLVNGKPNQKKAYLHIDRTFGNTTGGTKDKGTIYIGAGKKMVYTGKNIHDVFPEIPEYKEMYWSTFEKFLNGEEVSFQTKAEQEARDNELKEKAEKKWEQMKAEKNPDAVFEENKAEWNALPFEATHVRYRDRRAGREYLEPQQVITFETKDGTYYTRRREGGTFINPADLKTLEKIAVPIEEASAENKPADNQEPGALTAEQQAYIELARKNHFGKENPDALQHAIDVITLGTTQEHLEKALKETGKQHGMASAHRNLLAAVYREAVKRAPAKFKKGDLVTFFAAGRKDRIKARVLSVDNDTKQVHIKPEDTVFKEDFMTSESSLQPFEEAKPAGATAKVTTQAGTEIEVEYRIVPLFDLIYSHNRNGIKNPDYPENLQPRFRDAADSKIQAQEMALNLDPERLLENRLASDGAPIVGPDLVVESGNGRMMALETMLTLANTESTTGAQYDIVQGDYFATVNEFAKKHGLPSDNELRKIKHPVLVRVRLTDVDRNKFVAEANETSVSRMSATETALADAKKMSGIISLFVPSEDGNVNTAHNQEFIRKFISDVVPANDRREVRTKDGYLSQDGKERLERALFALAYEDRNALEKFMEDLDDNAKTVTGALLDAAPKLAVLNSEIAKKTILPEFDIRKDLVDSFNQLVELRRKGQDVEKWIEADRKQESLFDDAKLSNTAYELLYQFSVKKSRKRIRGILFNYMEYVLNDPRSKGTDLLGETATKEEFLQIAIERMDGGGSLFELETEARSGETENNGQSNGKTEESGSREEKKVVNPLPEDPAKVDWKMRSEYTKYIKGLVDAFRTHIKEGTLPTGKAVQKDIRAIADKALGRKATEDEWQDALEAAVQLEAHEARKQNPKWSIQEKIESAQRFENLLKNAGRSLEKLERQQFSTPIPLSLIVNYVANPFRDQVREGSAGTGSLIIPMAPSDSRILVNDYSPRRAAILSIVTQALRTEKSVITYSNMDLFKFQKPEELYTLIVGNPPFKGQNVNSKSNVNFNGKPPWKGGWGDLGNRFLAWDLRHMAEGGRLVYIVSGGVIDGAQNREFRKWLRDNHTVRAMVKFPSGVYDTRGTKFPTGLIVVEKGKKENAPEAVTGTYETLDELISALEPIRDRRSNQGQYVPPKEKPQPEKKAPAKKNPFSKLEDWEAYKNKHGLGQIYKSPLDLKVEELYDMLENWSDATFSGHPEKNRKAYENYANKVYKIVDKELNSRKDVTDADWKKLVREIFDTEVSADEVASNESGGTPSGASNAGQNAEVGGRGQRTAAGNQTGVGRNNNGGQPGTGGAGTAHDSRNDSGADGRSNGASAANEEEQIPVSASVQGEIVEPGGRNAAGNDGKKAARPADSILSGDTRYVPGRVVTGAEHRGNVTEAPNMRFVGLPKDIFTNDKYLPHPTVIKGGEWKLSDVQIESVMAAKYNFLENGKRGILIADDTGMGKTAQQLGIAADSYLSGRTKRILVVTTKDQVAVSSFIPENEKLGFNLPITHIGPDTDYIKKHGNTFKDKAFNEGTEYTPFQVGDGVLVMSKYTFRDSQQSVKKWLADSETDVMILMDESHEFANRESGLGKANVEIFSSFRDKAQFVYSSATAAEDIDGLEHMYGLHLWSADGFSDFKLKLTSADTGARSGGKRKTGMSAAFDRSGKSPFKREIPLTMMEQITRELKLEGQYIGRQLSMEGVEMDGLEIKLTPEEMGDWNRAVQFVGMIAEKAETYGRGGDGAPNPKQRGQIISQVVGYMRRLSGYYRLKAVIKDIQKQIADGTFERFGIIGEFKSGDDGQPANLFAAINAINDQDQTDVGDEIITSDIPEAIEDKEELLAILQGLNPEWGEKPVPEIPSPMELLYDAFGESNVAIVSGDVKAKDRPKVVKGFQDGNVPIIWFNSAGGTGVNMHDTIGKKIRVYTQDYPYNAKAQKQAEGRFNRTGQVTTPHYVYPYLNSSTDTKFVGTLIARYEAMGALSRGDVGKLGGEELASFDFTGEAAELAAYEIIPEIDPDDLAAMFGEYTRDITFIAEDGVLDETAVRSVFSGNQPEVKKFLNALMFLDFNASNRVFNQFTEKIQEITTRLEEQGGVKDKFETFKGQEVDMAEGKNGIKLRRIKTLLTANQKKSLDFALKTAIENEEKMAVEFEKVKQETLEKLEKDVESIQKKQEEERTERQGVLDRLNESYRKYQRGELEREDYNKIRERSDKKSGQLQLSILTRDRRLNEAKGKLDGLKKGNEEVIATIPDMRRAQVRQNNAKLLRMGAEANIERSDEILLVDGRIATNGLLVNIRSAIRNAAKRVYGEKNTPASALTLELRGYELENGERAIGAVVPKWAEGEVAKALEARMRYSGGSDSIEKLKAHLKAGNKVALQGGFELEWQPKLEQFRIGGMRPGKDTALYKSLNGGEAHIGFHTISRSFIILTDEGFRKILERFPILNANDSNSNDKSGGSGTPSAQKVKGYKVEAGTAELNGSKIWTLKPSESVPKDKWGDFAGQMKKFGGRYYSARTQNQDIKGRFVFDQEPTGVFDSSSEKAPAGSSSGSKAFSLGADALDHNITPKTAKRVSDMLANAMNTVLRTGNVRRKQAAASFTPHQNSGNVKDKYLHNIRITAHELGHAFEEYGFTGDKKELMDVAQQYYPAFDKLKTEKDQVSEGKAELFTLFILDPEEAAKVAPLTVEEIENVIADNKLLKRVFTDVSKLIASDKDAGTFERGAGSISFPSEKRKKRTIGDEYEVDSIPEDLGKVKGKAYEIGGWFKRKLTEMVDFKIPFKDMQKALEKTAYNGKDLVKALGVTGTAEETARSQYTSWARDHLGRYIVNYQSFDELPDYLEPLYDRLDAMDPNGISDSGDTLLGRYRRFFRQSGNKERAILNAISSRSLMEIATDGMEHIGNQVKRLPKDSELTKEIEKMKKENKKDKTEFMVFSVVAQAYRAGERYSRVDADGNKKFTELYMSEETVLSIIEESREAFPQLEALVQEYTDNLSNIILSKLVRAGVTTPEARTAIEEGSSFYIPTYYATSNPYLAGEAAERKTAGQPIKRFRGAQMEVVDFLRATIYKLTEVEQSVEFKQVLDAIEDGLKMEGMGKFGEFVSQKNLPKELQGEQIAKTVSDQLRSILGDDVVDENFIEDKLAENTFRVFFPTEMLRNKQPILMNWHGNKRVFMRLAPDLYNSIKSMRPVNVYGAMRMISRFSSFTRYLAIMNPRYFFSVISRDFFTAQLQKNAAQSTTIGFLKGAALAAGKDPQIVDQYITSGAFVSAQENLLSRFKRSGMTDGLIETKAKNWKKTAAGRFVHFISPGNLLQWQEQINRYGSWQAKAKEMAKEYGLDPKKIFDGREPLSADEQKKMEKIILELGYEASEVTTNFRTHGTSEGFRKVTMPITFLHGSIQGIYREAREMKNNPMRLFKRSFLGILPLTMLSWAMLQMLDDEADDIPSETKDKYWLFPVGNTYLAIAKPFGYALPMSHLERFMDDLFGGEDARKWYEDFWNPAKHNFALPLLPIYGSLMLELYSNKTWYGGKIVTDEYGSKFNQLDDKSSVLAELQADMLFGLTGDEKYVISPDKFDYAARGLFGEAGKIALNALDNAAGKDRDITKNPIGIPKDNTGSRFVDKFYKALDEVEKEHDREGIPYEPSEKVKAYRKMGDYMRDMNKLKKEARSSNLSAAEKEELEVRIQRAMKDLGRYTNGQEMHDPGNFDEVIRWVEGYRESQKR